MLTDQGLLRANLQQRVEIILYVSENRASNGD